MEDGKEEKKEMKKTILTLSPKTRTTFKMILFVIVVSFVFAGKAFGVPDADYPIIHDPIMYNWFSGMNTYVNENQGAADFFQISSSLLMDFSFFAMFIYWVIFINTGRILYATAIFYVTRSIMQNFVVFPFPDGYYWKDPGFPSLTVPYGRSSDFFWSGHCGFLTILICEWYV